MDESLRVTHKQQDNSESYNSIIDWIVLQHLDKYRFIQNQS